MIALLCSAASLAALIPQPQPTTDVLGRRALLASAAGAIFAVAQPPRVAFAKVSEIGEAGLSKEEFYEALAARKEAERVAALPINQLKRARDRFATAPSYVESNDWDGLRDIIRETTGPDLTALLKSGRFMSQGVLGSTNKLRKLLFDVDTFAYSQQKVPGADLFAGYCADGVVPRDDSACKVRPQSEKPPWIAKLKEGSAIFDEIVKLCDV